MSITPQSHEEISAANPYVGPRPFGAEDKRRFYGREREIADLYSLVVAHRTVLVYAQSGAGKTSLFNAGLVPLLVDSGFDVILPSARVSGHVADAAVGRLNDKINIYALNAVRTWAPKSKSDEEISRLSKPIPDYLSSLPRRYTSGSERIPIPNHPDDEPLPRVVIFDQFEELFTAYLEQWADRSGFFEQVNEAMVADPALRVIFGMREDFVAHIDPYEDLLPEEFRTRYRLEKLREIDALDAVKKPLEDTGVSFKSGVAESLVTDLLKTTPSSAEGTAGHEVPRPRSEELAVAESLGEFVEPVQLQVVCFNLFENLPVGTSEITKEHLKQFGDVDQALREFYESAVAEASRKAGIDPDSLRLWFESKLITEGGNRGLVFRGKDTTGGLSNSGVDALDRLLIIRSEMRGRNRWYELSHDRFVQPVLRANDDWRARFQADENRQREKQLRMEEQARHAKRFRRLSWALAGLFVLAATAGVYAFRQRGIAEKNAAEALKQQLLADQNAAEAMKQRRFAEENAAKASDSANFAQHAATLAEYRRNEAERSRAKAIFAEKEAMMSAKAARNAERVAQQQLVEVERAQAAEKQSAESAQQQGSQAQTARVKSTAVLSVAWSPDGQRLATGGQDRTAIVWDAANGRRLLTLPNQADSVSSVAWSPDGRRLATGVGDGTARIWDAENGRELLVLRGHDSAVYDVAWSPDGRRLATASDGARIWDADSGQELLTLKGFVGVVNFVAWSPDGKRLACAPLDPTPTVWDAASGEKLLTLRGHTAFVWSLAWSPDGNRLATGSNDDTAKVWDAANGKELLTLRHENSLVSYSVHSVVWSPDGRRLATAGADQTATVWDAASGKELLTLSPSGKGPVLSMSWSAKGNRLATATQDGRTQIWDAETGELLFTLPDPDSRVKD